MPSSPTEIEFELPTLIAPMVAGRFQDALTAELERRVLFGGRREYALLLHRWIRIIQDQVKAAADKDDENVVFRIHKNSVSLWYYVLWESCFTSNGAKTIRELAEAAGWTLKRERWMPREQIALP